MEKSVLVTTRSVRVGNSILYDYVPQGIIRVDLHVTSCQGTQVRLGSQMVEESSVLLQYHFEIAEEEFIIKEDGEMEARIGRQGEFGKQLSSKTGELCIFRSRISMVSTTATS